MATNDALNVSKGEGSSGSGYGLCDPIALQVPGG